MRAAAFWAAHTHLHVRMCIPYPTTESCIVALYTAAAILLIIFTLILALRCASLVQWLLYATIIIFHLTNSRLAMLYPMIVSIGTVGVMPCQELQPWSKIWLSKNGLDQWIFAPYPLTIDLYNSLAAPLDHRQKVPLTASWIWLHLRLGTVPIGVVLLEIWLYGLVSLIDTLVYLYKHFQFQPRITVWCCLDPASANGSNAV